MRAIVHNTYGSPDVLELQEIDKPDVADDEVLVRVRAASVNPADWYVVTGTPYVGRPSMGLRKPKSTRTGVDFAGTVEAVGRNVTQFRPGDEVFGGKDGAFAEYVCVREDRAVVPKPANVTFEQAGLNRGAAARLAAGARLAALRGQLHLAQADAPRRHLDALVLTDELERLVERQRARRDQAHQLFRGR